MSHELLCCVHEISARKTGLSWPDVCNGAFESIGAVCTWANFGRIRRDKQVRGVDWRVSFFFSAWGLWNLFYYPNLGQWFSFAGGVALVAGNIGWLYYAITYRGK